jgi:hypothetical protein
MQEVTGYRGAIRNVNVSSRLFLVALTDGTGPPIQVLPRPSCARRCLIYFA